MVEVATPGELAEIAKSASEIGGQVKTLSDLRFEKFKAEMDAKLARLEAENQELRSANAELYAYAQAKDSNKETTTTTKIATDELPVKKVNDVHAMEVVEDPQKAAEMKKKEETYEAAYQQALKGIGRVQEIPSPDPRASGINPNTPQGDGM